MTDLTHDTVLFVNYELLCGLDKCRLEQIGPHAANDTLIEMKMLSFWWKVVVLEVINFQWSQWQNCHQKGHIYILVLKFIFWVKCIVIGPDEDK